VQKTKTIKNIVAIASVISNFLFFSISKKKKKKQSKNILAIASVKKKRNLEYWGNCKCKK
jgi:hypothetical protein